MPDGATAATMKPSTFCASCTWKLVPDSRVPDATRAKGTRLCGDVHFASAVDVASKITPVPGGVGPMTIAMLLRNTVRAAEQTLATSAS